jgi:hypothetical protein
MNHDKLHPPSTLDDLNLDEMTLRELGDVAEAQGVTLLDILTV